MATQIQPNCEVESSVLQATKSGQDFLPYHKKLGSSYRVRGKSPHKTTVTSDTSCRFGDGVGWVPQTPSGFKICQKISQNLLKPIYIHTWNLLTVIVYYRERVQLKPVRGRDAQDHVCEGSNTKLLLSSGHITVLASMCIEYCQSQKLTEALVCRFFVVSAIYKHKQLIAQMIVPDD